MNQQIVNIKEENDYRIIAISDIHGHYEVIKDALIALRLNESDYLILLGDFINRGTDSYKTYLLIKELSQRKNTYVLKGNHEYNTQTRFTNKDKTSRMFEFLKRKKIEHIITSILQRHDRDISSFNSCMELYDFINNNYANMLSFFSNLPIMLNFNDFTFVHGGYDKEFKLPEDEFKHLKFDYYNERGKKNDKLTIVGHWPVSNIRTNTLSNEPYFNLEKNIILIDGGIGIKNCGELNAFIIENNDNSIEYEWRSFNNFTKHTVKHEYQFTKEESINIVYPKLEVEVIEEGDLMSLCKHIDSNKQLTVFNSLIVEDNGITRIKTDYINNFLNLKVDEEVELCKVYDDCALVKYYDEFGWVWSWQIF